MKIFEKYLWADFLYCCMILFRFGWFCTILFLVWKREDRRYVTAYVFVIVGRRMWIGVGQPGLPAMRAMGPTPENLPPSETLSANAHSKLSSVRKYVLCLTRAGLQSEVIC
jgi:hypothetical protein